MTGFWKLDDRMRPEASRVGHNDGSDSNLTEIAFQLECTGPPLFPNHCEKSLLFSGFWFPTRVGMRLAMNAAPVESLCVAGLFQESYRRKVGPDAFRRNYWDEDHNE